MTGQLNPHKDLAQLRKAIRLADQLTRAFDKATIDTDVPLSEIAEVAGSDLWIGTAQKAGVKPPSDETKQKVVSILREREARADDDPFEGFPQADEPSLVQRVKQDPRPRGARR